MTLTAAPALRLPGIDPGPHVPHWLHGSGRLYPETNCYTDVLIELLHARGDEPLAVLGSTLAGDFQGDQWTFFKPDPADLRDLFGVGVHEQMPYRHWPTQIAEQLRAGRTQLLEADAWHLPDTTGVSHRIEHVKSTIAVAALDEAGERLEYFHNGGCHTLAGDDYRATLRTDDAFAEALPLYTELVRFDAGPRLRGAALRLAARERLAGHLRRRPQTNPFTRLADWLDATPPPETAGGGSPAHLRIFATARMAGAAAELAAAHVIWLLADEGGPAAARLTTVAEGCKVLAFRIARGRPFDAAACLAPVAAAWEVALDDLHDRV